MSAYEEMVATGQAGPETLRMLLEVTAQTVRSRNYPDPARRGRWTQDDVAELAHEVALGFCGGTTFVDAVLSTAVDDRTLRAVVSRRVRTAFADRSRKTDTGHLANRVTKLLTAAPDVFVPLPGRRWALAKDVTAGAEQDSSEATAVGFDDLLRAAFAVDHVTLTRWSDEADRRSPFASAQDLSRLLEAVLARAEQPLPETMLVKVLGEYFGLSPDHVPLGNPDAVVEPVPSPDAASQAVSAVLADIVWAQLSNDERLIVPYLEDSLSTAAQQLGWSKTRTHRVRTAARTALARALHLDADTPTAGDVTAGADVLHLLQQRVTNTDHDAGAHPGRPPRGSSPSAEDGPGGVS